MLRGLSYSLQDYCYGGPDAFKAGLGLDLFIDEYRIWVGVAFLFFLATGLMPIFPWLFQFTKNKKKEHQIHSQFIKYLQKLTDEEKSVLRLFIDNETKTQDLNIQNGVVGRLMKISFLELGFNVSYGGHRGSYTFPVNIQDWLWEELKKNPEYIE